MSRYTSHVLCESASSTEELPRDIKLLVYSGHDAEYHIYEDGFDGYDYEKGKYTVTQVKWQENEQKLEIAVKRKGQAADCGKNGYIISADNAKVFRAENC